MLLERFGLWDARSERASAYSRGMLQRLALCRTLLHDPALLLSTSRTPRSTPKGPSCSTASWRSCAASARSFSRPTTPSASSGWQAPGWRWHDLSRRVLTLARKDLRLELRARDTLPAMLLFVVSMLVVFHSRFRKGRTRSRRRDCSGSRSSHRPPRARPRVGARAREQRARAGSSSRRATGARSGSARRSRSSSSSPRWRLVALPAFGIFFPRSVRRPSPESCSRASGSRRRHPARRDGRREPYARARPAAPLPAARDPARRRRRGRERLARRGPATWPFSRCTTCFCDPLLGELLSTSVTE